MRQVILAIIFSVVYYVGMDADQIIKHFGTKSHAADTLGVTLQTLRDWRKKGIPPRTQAWIQLQTNGKLKANRTERVA